MAIPTLAEAEVYKSPVIQSQVRVAVQLDYPVFNGSFDDHFDLGYLDTTKWFNHLPSWGHEEFVAVPSNMEISVTGNPSFPDNGISSPWLQSKHGLAFPLRRDTDWTFTVDCRFPGITGFGNFIAICGKSFKDVQAIWAVKADLAGGEVGDTNRLRVHMPYDGYYSPNNNVVWSTDTNPLNGRNFKVTYTAATQIYTWYVDDDNDGVFELSGTVAVNGRYADAIVIGNSVAIQGVLGTWTKVEVDRITVTGTAETVTIPEWAANKTFTKDSHTFAYLPSVVDGHVTIDKDNVVDAAELTLDNFDLKDVDIRNRTYTWTRFLHKRAIIEARVGNTLNWLPWRVLFDGECGEKQLSVNKSGLCTLTLPMRDRYRAAIDDKEINAAYADTGADVIPDVGHNLTVAEIIADLFNKAGLDAANYTIQATAWNIPRNYNVFRTSALQASKSLADQTALALYQRFSDGHILINDWYWGTDAPTYFLSTEDEIDTLEWTETAFEATVAEELGFESTEYGHIQVWPPHREPYYGKITHSASVACQDSESHDHRPIDRLTWWIRNRKVGSVRINSRAQLWVDHDLEVGVIDDRFLGLGRGESWIIDGWEHSWSGQGPISTSIRLINTHPDKMIRQALVGA